MRGSEYQQTAQPDMRQARILEQRVWEQFERGKTGMALKLCAELNRSYPDYPPGWRSASQLALRRGNADGALQMIEKALSLQPGNTDWLLQKARCLSKLGHYDELEQLLILLCRRDLDNAYQCSALAFLLNQLSLAERALEYYQRAAAFEPEEPQHYFNIASVQRFIGDLAGAEESFTRSINLDNRDCEAYRLRSELRRQTPDSNHIDELQRRLDRESDPSHNAVQLCYALAKELEDIDQPERAFPYLKRGADTRRRLMRYSPEGDIQTMANIEAVYHSGLFDGHIEGCDNTEAIFILGMPRTGTTLVERMLSHHTEVVSMGELNNFAMVMVNQVRRSDQTGQLPKETLVNRSRSLDFKVLGEAYIRSLKPRPGSTSRFIDKLPLNFLYTGLIHLALPKAKIIHLCRHPLDTCYAVYKQLFKDAYPFSYDLQELAHYYLAYRRLMVHWEKVMPGVVHKVRYEDLVADPSGELNRLLAYLDLDWQPQCLLPHENPQASTTASAAQIRRPIYTSSVGRWKDYEKQLKPITTILTEAGIDLHRY